MIKTEILSKKKLLLEIFVDKMICKKILSGKIITFLIIIDY